MRRRLPSPPKPDPNGTYLRTEGEEIYISFDDLQQACAELMEAPADMVADLTGKVDYKNDPTYNLRKKK